MTEWNLIAEWTAGLYILILIIYSRKINLVSTVKERLFRYATYSVFLTIVLNLASTYAIYTYESIPLWCLEILLTIYYLSLPLSPVVCFYYSITLIYSRRTSFVLSKKWRFALIPYFLYVVVILFNSLFNNVFILTQKDGYIQQELFKLPYYISFIYVFTLIMVTFFNRKKLDREIVKVIYTLPIFSISISIIQLFLTDVILFGTAMSASILVIHLYLQAVQRTTDKLTGVLNRETLLFSLNKRIQQEQAFSVVMFSIRNFKGINERMGFVYGDLLLEEIAEYLKTKIPKDFVYRYSGDQFAIVFEEDNEENDRLQDEIFARFKEGWAVEEDICLIKVVRVKIDYPKFCSNIKDLMSNIDYALAKLKSQNCEGTCEYDAVMYNQIRRKNDIIERLKDAIANDGIEVHYQPIYSAKEKTFTQAEALMRLKDNKINPVYPDEFIPIAEETGLIVPLTYVILEKVCIDLRKIMDRKAEKIHIESISVNVPYIQFLQADIIECFINVLEKHKIPTDKIKIEITERTLVSDTDTVRRVMEQMQKKGFVFEIDDFGVDYSNISLFMQLPINIVKLDRSLILTAIENDKNKRFFECLIKGLNALEAKIIAEGVEDETTLDYIINSGCESVQGYVFSKPLPYDEFIEYLVNYKSEIESSI